MKKITFSILFFITFLVTSQKSDEFNRFVHLSTAQGLSQNSVLAIEQDDLGQMWIGTRDGVNAYDGEQISVFRNIPGDSTSISNNDILSIRQDKDGILWIGTQHGLSAYNPKKRSFKNFYYSSKKNSIPHNTIKVVTPMKNGEIWIGTLNGLSVYNKEKDVFINYTNDPYNEQSISNNFINEIYEDSAGDIWIGTSLGLNKVLNKDITKLIFQRFYIKDPKDQKSSFVQAIEEDAEGKLWIGTRYNNLRVFNKNKNIFEFPAANVVKKLISKDIRSLRFDENKNLWIASYNGLFIKRNDDTVVHVTQQYGNPNALSRNTLKKVFIDRQGSVWIGAYYGGLNIWDKYYNNFNTVFKIEDDKAFPLGVVSSIEEDAVGNLYFGTEGKGITVIDNNRNTNISITNALNTQLKNVNVKSLFLDKQKLWIGTFNEGIKCFDIRTEKFTDFLLKQDSLVELLKGSGVYSIVRIDEYMFFGTFGQGVIVYNIADKQIKLITSNPSDVKSLTNNRIRNLFVDDYKNLWIGTESGLNRISYSEIIAQKYVVQRFLFEEKNFFGNDISTIQQNSAGVIFVGTKGEGVFEFTENEFLPINLTTQNTTINTIYGIVEDNDTNLWINNNHGIIKYDPVHKKKVLYDQTDGFIGNEFNNNSCKRISTGELYFGGSSGVSFFNPLMVEKNSAIPEIILTDFKVQGKSITNFEDQNSILKESISYTDKIKLKYDQSSFSLNFAMPNYINSSNNKYKYRLIGLDNDWKYSATPAVNYTIPRSGKYVFEVQGVGVGENISQASTKLSIEVVSAPWKSPAAFIAYFLLIVLALFGLNQINKSRNQLEHRLELQRVEKIKQQELNKSKLEFFTNISHEFRTPLSLILGPLQQVIDTYQGSSKIYKRLLVTQRNADQLLKLINQLLDFRKFENKHSKLQVAEGNIVKFLKEIYLSFYEHSKIGNYEYTFTTPSDYVGLYFDRYKLERVFYNLISNAFKYTPEGGKIEVRIIANKENVSIEVSDNGKGVDKKFVEKIFDRFYEIAGDKNYQKQFNQASGIGLSIAKKAVDLHKGQIKILDNFQNGSVFRVTLPTGKEHLDEKDIIKDFKISDDVSQYTSQMKEYKPNSLDINIVDKEKDTPLILIAEDNDELRNFIGDILKDFYQVIKTENGKKAFKKALQNAPDLIISDVIMPEMEGTELCAKIKGDIRTSHIPFILLTSRTSLVYKFDGLESGADAYLNKPFNIKELLFTINNLLETTKKIKKRFATDNFNFENHTVTSVDEELLKKAIKIVEKNVDNTSFNIPFFSSELGVSRTILFAKIKRWTNLTPNEFIHSIRMKRASELLELGQINVSEVCYKVGFRNPKYFTKCFKKHFDQTPTEYASKFY